MRHFWKIHNNDMSNICNTFEFCQILSDTLREEIFAEFYFTVLSINPKIKFRNLQIFLSELQN